MPPLKICLAAAELAPLAKTGGLGDVCAALAAWLDAHDQEVRAFLPLYSSIDAASLGAAAVEFARDVPIATAAGTTRFTLVQAALPGAARWLYLVDCPRLYDRGSIYTSDPDEPWRFAFFTRAVLESCQRLGWAPDVLHLNDWHTALGPLYLREVYGWDELFASTRTLLTLHNIAYQGIFPSGLLPALGLANEAHLFDPEDLREGRINFLKSGIRHADHLSTVSPTHAREIRTPELGRGLDPWLRARADRLTGILNGVDYSAWSPDTDPLIPFRYDREDLSGKEKVKRALLEELSLPYEPDVAAVGIVSRLVAQKGFELLFEPLPDLLARRDLRLVVLGSGELRYERFFTALQSAFPDRVGFYRGFSEKLAHWIEAGCDIFLMPSAFEPCGLNQMYSLRYGTVPVVRATGGLADTVQPFDPATGSGTGFVFAHYDPAGVRWALERALDAYGDRELWRRLMRNGMERDFSWERQGHEYLRLYRALAV